MKGISFLAVLVGFIFDLVLSLALAFIIALAVAELVSTLPFLPFAKAYPLWHTIGGSMVAVAFILLGSFVSQLIFGDKKLA